MDNSSSRRCPPGCCSNSAADNQKSDITVRHLHGPMMVGCEVKFIVEKTEDINQMICEDLQKYLPSNLKRFADGSSSAHSSEDSSQTSPKTVTERQVEAGKKALRVSLKLAMLTTEDLEQVVACLPESVHPSPTMQASCADDAEQRRTLIDRCSEVDVEVLCNAVLQVESNRQTTSRASDMVVAAETSALTSITTGTSQSLNFQDVTLRTPIQVTEMTSCAPPPDQDAHSHGCTERP